MNPLRKHLIAKSDWKFTPLQTKNTILKQVYSTFG